MHLSPQHEPELLIAKQLVAGAQNVQEVPNANVSAVKQFVPVQRGPGKQGRRVDPAPLQFAQDQARIDRADRVHGRKIRQCGAK